MEIKKEKAKDFFIALAIVFVGAVFLLFFKIRHSMTFPNLDEFLWMYRSRFFMDRVLDLDFANLIQSYHPGIMVMWATGPFMKIINYDFNSIVRFIQSLNDSGVGYNVINSQDQDLYSSYKGISFLFNIPIFTAIFLFIFSLYYLLRKLAFSRWAIIFSLLLIVTTPYYIYFTTPTDKFVGIFSTLGVLSLLVHASGKGAKKFLILAGIFSAWAALTKMSALFLIPFSFFILAVYKLGLSALISRNCADLTRKNAEILSACGGSAKGGKFLSDKLNSVRISEGDIPECRLRLARIFKLPFKNILKDFLLWFAIFFLTGIIFFPTILANPRAVMGLITKESSERIITENHSLLFAPSVAFAYLSDPFALSFNLFAIIIFFGFLFLLIKKIFKKTGANNEIPLLYLYVFSFFAFIVLFSKTYSFRYLVPILIIFQILAGIGIYEFANIFIEKYKVADKKLIYLWAIIFILISQGLLIYYSEIARIENLPYFG